MARKYTEQPSRALVLQIEGGEFRAIRLIHGGITAFETKRDGEPARHLRVTEPGKPPSRAMAAVVEPDY